MGANYHVNRNCREVSVFNLSGSSIRERCYKIGIDSPVVLNCLLVLCGQTSLASDLSKKPNGQTWSNFVDMCSAGKRGKTFQS